MRNKKNKGEVRGTRDEDQGFSLSPASLESTKITETSAKQ